MITVFHEFASANKAILRCLPSQLCRNWLSFVFWNENMGLIHFELYALTMPSVKIRYLHTSRNHRKQGYSLSLSMIEADSCWQLRHICVKTILPWLWWENLGIQASSGRFHICSVQNPALLHWQNLVNSIGVCCQGFSETNMLSQAGKQQALTRAVYIGQFYLWNKQMV